MRTISVALLAAALAGCAATGAPQAAGERVSVAGASSGAGATQPPAAVEERALPHYRKDGGREGQ